MRPYILNLETSKIEIHFDGKSEYQALPDTLKREINRCFLWSSKANAWVSRSKNSHCWAIEVAKKCGFTEEERKGERISYAEQMERKTERAEDKAERYEGYAENAEKRGKEKQAEFNRFRGDIAFLTQPNINSSAGRAFTNRRNKIMARYESGMEEYRKSAYFKGRAETARETAEMPKMRSKEYLHNRIKECNTIIKKRESNLVHYEERLYKINSGVVLTSSITGEQLTTEKYEKIINDELEKIEWEIDKLAYFQNALEDLGGIQYNSENVKPGYIAKIHGGWGTVLKSNPKTVEILTYGLNIKYSYSSIQEVKIPEGWTEPKETKENPFKVGDIFKRSSFNSNNILHAYQCVSATEKTIAIQEIEILDNNPQKDVFKSGSKPERKTPKKNRQGDWVLNDGDWYLYKYTEQVESIGN